MHKSLILFIGINAISVEYFVPLHPKSSIEESIKTMNIKSISSKLKGNPKMVEGTVYSMLIICSISHFLNDMMQSIIAGFLPNTQKVK